MRTIFSIVKQLLGYLDRPSLNEKDLDIRAIERQFAEAQRYVRRAAQWNGQMEYFRGVAWMTTLLALLVAAGMAGMASWDWFIGPCDVYAQDFDRLNDRKLSTMSEGYLSLFVTSVITTVIGSLVLLTIEARVSDLDSPRPSSQDMPTQKDEGPWFARALVGSGRGLRKLPGHIVVIGSLVGVFETAAFMYNADSVRPLLISLLAGLLGALISVMGRMSSGKLTVDYEAPLSTLRFLGGFRPIIGSVFGVIIYILLTIGLINLSSLPGGTGSGPNLHLYFALAFLAGFSERLAPDILDSAARRFGQDDSDRVPERPARESSDRT